MLKEEITMNQACLRCLPRLETSWRLSAAWAVLFAGAFVPLARADIFVSHGAGDVDSGLVSSFSQYTGAPKLSFTGGLVWGVGVAFGPDENLYVADQNSGAVLRYNPSTGALIGTFTAPFSPPAPFAITFGPDGNLYMADDFGFIRRYNGSTGALLGAFSCAPPSGGNCYPVSPDVWPRRQPLCVGVGQPDGTEIQRKHAGVHERVCGSNWRWLSVGPSLRSEWEPLRGFLHADSQYSELLQRHFRV